MQNTGNILQSILNWRSAQWSIETSYGYYEVYSRKVIS